MKFVEYDNRPKTNTLHDLRSSELIVTSPLDYGKLLELGLKFCIQEERHIRNKLNDTFSRFVRDVRIKFAFAGEEHEKMDCHKKIYVKSSWQPSAASEQLEDLLLQFEQEIRAERDIASKRPKATNLSRYQFATLQHLRSNRQVIVLICDKNLGPAVMQRDTYIAQMLSDHLQDGKKT